MTTPGKSRYTIKNVGGVDYADPLNDERYLVKYYEMPPKEDLAAYIGLMESFERRFLHTADHGDEIEGHKRDLNEYIDAKHQAFQSAESPEKEQIGAQLCVAFFDRGVEKAKQHLQLLIDGMALDDPWLNVLHEEVGKDLMEGVKLVSYLRRKNGQPDIDDVVNEMKGEPYNIYMGAVKDFQIIRFFHDNRFLKVANAMKCMDSICKTVEQLGVEPEIKRTFLSKLETMTKHAKERVQLCRDDSAFAEENRQMEEGLKAIHASLSETQPASTRLPADYQRGVSQTAKDMIKDAADMIYDIAHVRNKRLKSAAILKERVSEYISAQNAAPAVAKL